MPGLEAKSDIIAEAVRVARNQAGGTLGTMHAEDGTPYLTFVFFHMADDGSVIIGSSPGTQHARNMIATPEVSFLIDTRNEMEQDWNRFDRVVLEGRAEIIDRDDARYAPMLASFREKNEGAATFTERGEMFCIHPRRMQLRKGLDRHTYAVEFDQEPA